MIANLPLLFSNGKPTALSNIGSEELEKFITFIVTCSWGHDTVKDVRKPPWWPEDVLFSHPFVRPKVVPKNWDLRLRNLVKKCYDYHKSAFLLAFSDQLARYPRNRLKYVDNRDHTTSLYYQPNGKLLVTFRNENIFYDTTAKKDIYETQIKSTDIYLCDNCDSHFDNLNTLKAHERLCNNEVFPTGSCSGGLPEFLSALRLQQVGTSVDGPKSNTVDNEVKSKNIRTAANVDRGPPYPFSSLAYMRNTKSVPKDTSHHRDKIEKYCCTITPNSKSLVLKGKQQQFPVRYRRPIDYRYRTHIFPNQRNKKILDIQGQLLMLKCRPVTVDVERMSVESIQKYINDMKQISKTKAQQVMEDKDIIFVDNIECDQPADMEMKISDPLKRLDNDCEVIDLCSDDESPSVNENCDPRAGVTCVIRGGAVLRRTAATPQLLPAEPCGARQKPLPAAVLHPHPVILIARTLNSIQTISLD